MAPRLQLPPDTQNSSQPPGPGLARCACLAITNRSSRRIEVATRLDTGDTVKLSRQMLEPKGKGSSKIVDGARWSKEADDGAHQVFTTTTTTCGVAVDDSVHRGSSAHSCLRARLGRGLR